jgi:hydrogenase/urease accessory protein HupE
VRLLVAAASALVTLLGCATPVRAHEIGTTRVTAVLNEGRGYAVEVVTDAEALVEKLDLVAGRPPLTARVDAEVLRERLLARVDVFRRRLVVAFDGTAVRPLVEYSVAPRVDATSAPRATIRLTGAIPPGARDFTWTYGWTFASYSLSVQSINAAEPAIQWLEGGQVSSPAAVTSHGAGGGHLQTAARYLALGFTHILPYGLDHVLFVIGVFLLSARLQTVLWQVSAFTIAHSLTLALSIYGVITVPPSIVEPLIAVSIAYIAIENVLLSELKARRVVLVFAFGLLHGMGFAGALRELGLPRSQFLTALLTFNVGVEAGQLAVIAAAFLLVGWHCRQREWYRGRVVVPASMLIACTAAYWTVQRIVF